MQRESDGCPTVRPSEWAAFIQRFLDENPSLEAWYVNGTYYGREAGVLIVE